MQEVTEQVPELRQDFEPDTVQAKLPGEQAPASAAAEPAGVYVPDEASVIGTPESADPLSQPGLLGRHNTRILKLLLMTLVFITALYTREYSGLYQQVINNHVGGTMYVLFGSLLFSFLRPRWQVYKQVSLALALTSLLEVVQWFRFPFMMELTRIKAFALLFGNNFNPVDFAYYALGAVLGILVLWMVRE